MDRDVFRDASAGSNTPLQMELRLRLRLRLRQSNPGCPVWCAHA
jgi:hypothetical protein